MITAIMRSAAQTPFVTRRSAISFSLAHFCHRVRASIKASRVFSIQERELVIVTGGVVLASMRPILSSSGASSGKIEFWFATAGTGRRFSTSAAEAAGCVTARYFCPMPKPGSGSLAMADLGEADI